MLYAPKVNSRGGRGHEEQAVELVEMWSRFRCRVLGWPGFLEDKFILYLYRYSLKVLCNGYAVMFDVLER